LQYRYLFVDGNLDAGKAYRNLLKAYGFIGSMSRPGNCWDNAVAESLAASSRNAANGGITKLAMKQKQQNQ